MRSNVSWPLQFESRRGKNFQLIEHLLRKGAKQLTLMRSSTVTGMAVVQAPPPPKDLPER